MAKKDASKAKAAPAKAAPAEEVAQLPPMPVPHEKPVGSGTGFVGHAAAVLALQATAAVGLAVWLEPRLTDPAAAGQTVTELAATLMSDDGTVTKRISGVGAAALLAGVTALLIMAYQMGRGAGGGYSKPKRGSVGGSVVSQLKKIVGDKNVHTSGVEMSKHGRDMSFHDRHPPDVVVYCEEVEQVRDVVKVCYDNYIPCVPRGAGTGLEGGCIPYEGGVALDLKRMKKMELRADDMQAVLGPGCIKNDINKWLEPSGFLFGPDPASNPSVGGMASTRGSGLSTMMYGTTAENMLSMLVVTAEGKLIRTRQCTRKSSTGYELNQLYIGSEGTLGVIVELVVKIYPIMPVRTGALVRFPDVAAAARAVIKIVQAGPKSICRCELLNADGIRATNVMYKTELQDVPTIFMEFRGQTLTACQADSTHCIEIAMAYGAVGNMETEDAAEMDQMWAARRGCYLAAGKYREMKGDSVYLSDTCVPISKLAESIAETEKDFVSNDLPAVICAHIADGNFHCCVPYQPKCALHPFNAPTLDLCRLLLFAVRTGLWLWEVSDRNICLGSGTSRRSRRLWSWSTS